jgi:TolA-binding protein
MENKNYRLHTPNELENIASTDYERFKTIAKYYFDNDIEYFEKEIVPIVDKYKKHIEDSNEITPADEIIEVPFEKNNQSKGDVESELAIHRNNGKLKQVKDIIRKTRRNLNKKTFYTGIVGVIILSAIIILYYFLIYNSSDRQGVRYLKDKKFDLAIQQFGKIDPTSVKYDEIKQLLSYAWGGKDFNERNYRDALINLKKVQEQNEYFQDAKMMIEKINNDPEIIYLKAINDINANDYNEAITWFQKVKPNDSYFSRAQSKIVYVRGLIEYNLGNYEAANAYFLNVDKADEFYSDIVTKQTTIDYYLVQKQDIEANKSYAHSLLETADRIQDEYELTKGQSFYYIENTLIPTLVNLRATLNSTSNYAKNKSSKLSDFKDLILKWVNSYIKYAESLYQYGSWSNYNADNMWYNYGYLLNPLKDAGTDLHKKVVKIYKEIRSEYNLK